MARTFINFLLWYLGCLFSLMGIAFIGVPMLMPIVGYYIPPPSHGGFAAAILILAVAVGICCKVRFWAPFVAWVIGLVAVSVPLVLIDRYIQHLLPFLIVGYLLIGLALVLNRWRATQRAKAEAAATTAVFD
jgi:hypothetical protein